MNNTISPLVKLPNTYRAFYGTFTHLTAAQLEVIDPLLEGHDLILQASTGSGKTEAVLAPTVERLITSKRKHKILYIVPTRALAIDLERRLMPIFSRLDLKFGIRIGDVKRMGGKNPDLLLTTPESLDVMLGSSNRDIRNFSNQIQIIIIDESHAFLENYRGRQLALLLKRLERRKKYPLQKIAISATIENLENLTSFFDINPNAFRYTSSTQRDIIPHLVHLKNEERELPSLINDCYQEWGYRKILIFANNRGACDHLHEILNRTGRFKGITELHYSNLKPKERRGAEIRFRKRPFSICIATSTLELGIDIGDVDGVFLFEPPESVTTFLQRIGRANRRQKSIHFWGICRETQPGQQLLRFLGLLNLARNGKIEDTTPKRLPSVIIQQILSCLYEKKETSLSSLTRLFPEEKDFLIPVFDLMKKQSWFREASISGLFKPSWRYRDYFLDRKIWSNFPDTEEEYILEMEGESIADLPKSVVDQLEIGDCIQLAGKRTRIQSIIEGEKKRVVATTTPQIDSKEIMWLGGGFRVSYEVAQSIRKLMESSKTFNENSNWGLFSRTRKLLNFEYDFFQKTLLLANGMRLGKSFAGFYRYHTFIGALGNLILQWTLEHSQLAQQDDFVITSDDTGIECSHLIDFQILSLPKNRDEFSNWIRPHMKAVSSLLQLNSFCKFLSPSLLLEEITDFIFDERLAKVFSNYEKIPFKVIQGNIKDLDDISPNSQKETISLSSKQMSESFLEWERTRWKQNNLWSPLDDSVSTQYVSKALTGTLIGDYFRKQQCERSLSFHFLDLEQIPKKTSQTDDEISLARMEWGQEFEVRVLENIQSEFDQLIIIDEFDASGTRLSLSQRFQFSLSQIEESINFALENPEQKIILSQVVLLLPSYLHVNENLILDAIGIPDLIQISIKDGHPFIQIGDIKSSHRSQYSQKWQVAFYSFLLKQIVSRYFLKYSIKISSIGIILTQSFLPEKLSESHEFDLKPFWASLPEFWRSIQNTLSKKPQKAEYKLDSFCATCRCFEHCYQQALWNEEILFIPNLTAGILQKLRNQNLKTFQQVQNYFTRNDKLENADFTPNQRERLISKITALQTGVARLRSKETDLYSEKASLFIFFHLHTTPVSGILDGMGWVIMEAGGGIKDQQIIQFTKEQPHTEFLEECSNLFLKAWNKWSESGEIPHIFYFGASVWTAFQDWFSSSPLDFLWASSVNHSTNLQILFSQNFDLPIPGKLTLFAINRLLRFSKELTVPDSFFHSDIKADYTAEDLNSNDHYLKRENYLKQHLTIQKQIGKWAFSHLKGKGIQHSAPSSIDIDDSHKISWLNFLEEEQRLKSNSTLELQRLSLEERVQRYRSIGPLVFEGNSLDEEGCFLYQFSVEWEKGESKFREGDFLKLTPLGTPDLQQGKGVILEQFNRHENQVWLRSRQGKLACNKNIRYSLEEDLTDWTTSKLTHAVETVFADSPHPLSKLLSGEWIQQQNQDSLDWATSWLASTKKISGLNPAQQEALKQTFQYQLSLIEGPPGTGKTHLLGWILIALFLHARETGNRLFIVISALTHHAIDQVLKKVVDLVNQHQIDDFPAKCFKWGRWDASKFASEATIKVEALNNSEELQSSPFALLGATGFGLYQLFEGKKDQFPQLIDWVVFDEASQILIPQSLLSLLYGKGSFLFLGDIQQLPPIVLGNSPLDQIQDMPYRSILEQLLEKYPAQQIRLNITYRMNQTICEFPSQTWYDGELQPDAKNADTFLDLPNFQIKDQLDKIINPEQAVSLVLLDHHGKGEKCDFEADLLASLTHRLLINYNLKSEQLAIISPHRAQNNIIRKRLEFLLKDHTVEIPLIDTVERMQGAERDVILFGFTTSDSDQIESDFLNSPNRFNVVITRAKKKLIVIGSKLFFHNIAHQENILEKNSCFKDFIRFCEKQNSLYSVKEDLTF